MSESTLPYRDLADALRERLSVIGDRELYARDPATHLTRLQAASERIDALQQQLPPPVDPQLAHFLQRSSFDKALAFIDHLHGPRTL